MRWCRLASNLLLTVSSLLASLLQTELGLRAMRVVSISLGPMLQQVLDQGQGLLLPGSPDGEPGHGHWYESGHDLAARQLAPWLCQQ